MTDLPSGSTESSASSGKIKNKIIAQRSALWLPFDLLFLLRPSQFLPIWATLTAGFLVPQIIKNPDTFFSISLSSDYWMILLLVSLGSGGIFVFNQIADIDTDTINEKLFILPMGLVFKLEAYFLAFALGILVMSMVPFISMQHFFLFSICGVIGMLYNFRPGKWKNHPWLSVFVHFMGGSLCFLSGALIISELSISVVLMSLPYAMAWSAVFVIVTIPDLEGDRQSDKRTFSVSYGIYSTLKLANVLVIIALVLSVWNRDIIFIFASGIALIYYVKLFTTYEHGVFTPVKLSFMLLLLGSMVFAPEFILPVLAVILISRWYYHVRFNVSYPSFSSKN